MLVGSGMIASLFQCIRISESTLVHAAGVSNSSCISPSEFLRDRQLLEDSLDKCKRIIYFSSQACGDSELITPYLSHKRQMESLILENSTRHVVLRIPQVAAKLGNPKNLVNAFHNKLLNDETVICYPNVRRNLIKDTHIKLAFDHIETNYLSGLLSFCSPYDYTPLEIIRGLEIVSGLSAQVEILSGDREEGNFRNSNEFVAIGAHIFNNSRKAYLLDVIEHAIL